MSRYNILISLADDESFREFLSQHKCWFHNYRYHHDYRTNIPSTQSGIKVNFLEVCCTEEDLTALRLKYNLIAIKARPLVQV